MFKRALLLSILMMFVVACGGQQTTDEDGLAEGAEPSQEEEVVEEEPAEEVAEEEDSATEQDVLMMKHLEGEQEAVQACYSAHLDEAPEAEGKVAVMLTLNSSGTTGEVTEDEIGGDVGECIVGVLNQIVIEDASEEDVHITVPYHFAPGR